MLAVMTWQQWALMREVLWSLGGDVAEVLLGRVVGGDMAALLGSVVKGGGGVAGGRVGSDMAVTHYGILMSSPWVGPNMGVHWGAQWQQWWLRIGGGGGGSGDGKSG
jgi:hypothetical protein